MLPKFYRKKKERNAETGLRSLMVPFVTGNIPGVTFPPSQGTWVTSVGKFNSPCQRRRAIK